MLLVDDGIIKEGDLDLAILAFHHAERAYSNRPSNKNDSMKKCNISCGCNPGGDLNV